MSLCEYFVRKPVHSIVLSLLILIIGAASYFILPLRQFPKIKLSVISVQTNFPGASAKLIESDITAPIERALSGINGVDYIQSSSSMNTSSVTLAFKLGYNIDQAMSDIRDKLNTIKYKMPSVASDSVIIKQDPNTVPIIYLSFASQLMSSEQITDYLKRALQPSLETIQGVSQASLIGERSDVMKIYLNPNLMAKHNVASEDILTALKTNHLQSPGGRLQATQNEYEVNANTDLDSEKKFNDLIILKSGDSTIRIKDIGQAVFEPCENRTSVIVNNKPSILIGITPRSDGNPLTIKRDITARLVQLKKQMPSDLNTTIVWDSTQFIASSIKEVKKTIVEATVFVLLIMLVFIGSFRLLFIPMITIPLSLIGICSFLLIMDFSLNTMTLLAMVLAIGLVVDDSIVVCENIYRHIQEGLSPFQAAIKGSNEVQLAIIAMTLTLAAVFIPIGFLNGLTGSLFKEFSFTLAGSVIISGIISLILSPMMCSKMITFKFRDGIVHKNVDDFFCKMADKYIFILHIILRKKFIVPFLLLVSVPFDVLIFQHLPKELAPKEDSGAILTVAQGPTNTNLKYIEKYTQPLNTVLENIPEKMNVAIINGGNSLNSAIAYTTLKSWQERKRSVQEIINPLHHQLWNIPGITTYSLNPYSLPGASGMMPISLFLQTTGNYVDLLHALQTVMEKMSQSNLFMNIDTNLKVNSPMIEMDINRDLASELGIPISSIANTISVALGNPEVAQFNMDAQNYDVIPTLYPLFKQSPKDINLLTVRTKHGDLVPLSNLVDLREVTKQKNLYHFQELRSAQITAGLAPGVSLSEAIKLIENTAKKNLGDNFHFQFTGEARQFEQTGNTMLIAFVFALIFIFLLLSAQFESFISPLIVLCSLFFSVTGALVSLKIFGYSSNIYTQIGLLTLIGLISKHGILIVEFANQLKRQGRGEIEAVLEAANIRLRPILMTTATMVLGALPLCLAEGAGAISRKQIGLVIMSGMTIGTLMTIFVIPAIYMIVEDWKKSFHLATCVRGEKA